LNLKGEVIGMNTAIAEGAQNIGFAIPVNRIKRDIDSVKENGKIEVPFLGVRYRMITPEFAENQNLSIDYGALIRGSEDGPAVFPNSSADKAGLRAEDIIIEVNNKKVSLDQTLGQIIEDAEIGDEINLKVLRNGKEIEIKATLEERPEL
jgi:S1-C subfamily serine protease